jgi:hypothetical protein
MAPEVGLSVLRSHLMHERYVLCNRCGRRIPTCLKHPGISLCRAVSRASGNARAFHQQSPPAIRSAGWLPRGAARLPSLARGAADLPAASSQRSARRLPSAQRWAGMTSHWRSIGLNRDFAIAAGARTTSCITRLTSHFLRATRLHGRPQRERHGVNWLGDNRLKSGRTGASPAKPAPRGSS